MIGRRPSIVSALEALKPKSEWTLRGETYADLEWLDKSQTKPTEDEINTKIADVEFALDLFQDNGTAIVLKKAKSKLNPNAVAAALGSNIGQSYKRGDKLTVKWAFKDLNKMREVLNKEKEIAEAKVKLFS